MTRLLLFLVFAIFALLLISARAEGQRRDSVAVTTFVQCPTIEALDTLRAMRTETQRAVDSLYHVNDSILASNDSLMRLVLGVRQTPAVGGSSCDATLELLMRHMQESHSTGFMATVKEWAPVATLVTTTALGILLAIHMSKGHSSTTKVINVEHHNNDDDEEEDI